MTRRILVSIALFALLSGAAVLILREAGGTGDSGSVAEAPAAGSTSAVDASSPGSLRNNLFRRTQRSALAGRVVDPAGKGIPGARVNAHGPMPAEVTAGPNGAWRLGDLEAGDYVLFASSGLSASDPVGPVPLGPGEELRDLALVLEGGSAISGTVLDSRDGKPVAGATVAGGASRVTADEKGAFRLTGLPGGTVVLTASAEGYVPRTSEVELTRGRERTGTELHLDRAGRVKGRVTSNGAPVAGAEVWAARYGFASRLSSLSPVAVTDLEGAFAGDVPPGRMELVARAVGYAEARTEEFELGAGEEREANLSLGQGGTVFGAVRDPEGAGVGGCKVEAFDTIHGRTTAASDTGTGGQYWIAGVPQAIYLIVASCNAGRAELGGVRVADGAQVQVDLRLGAGTIAGRVVDSAGKPVAGAAIAARPDGSAAPESPAGSSRADGSFELHGLTGSRFAVSATAPQGRAERAGVVPGTKDIVLALGSGDLEGKVVGDRGEPVTDFVVYAEPLSLEAGRPRSQRFLSPAGDFKMSLSPGRYGLKVGAPGYSSSGQPSVEVREGAPGPKVKIVLTKGTSVSGRTVDPEGKPIGGVKVASDRNMLYAFGRAAPVSSGAFALSDESGAFVLNGVHPGDRMYLFASKEGYEQRGATPVNAASGKVEGVEVRLFAGNRNEDAEREFAGVGMTLSGRNGAVQVVEVFEGGPAREAGIRPGDLVTSVDGAPTAGMPLNDVIARIRGEVGTTVTVGVRREGRDFSLSIARAVVKF
ncbi:MAG: carboxypeptidase regulatory-like domain-containing protein [Myxococcales bacterium]